MTRACGNCERWRRYPSNKQPYPREAELRPEFQGTGSAWVSGWCGVMSQDTWESTFCHDHAPAARPSRKA